MKKLSRVLSLTLILAVCLSCMATSVFAHNNYMPPEAHLPDDAPLYCPDCGCLMSACNRCYYVPEGPYDPDDPSSRWSKVSVICGCMDNPCNQSNCQGDLCVSSSAEAPVHEKAFVPDTSGNFRTTVAKITETVKPAEVAKQQLYIDPVTNTVANLYDSMGNLIPCTLSSDGHFYIVPSNDGYAYIPTGR